MGEVNYDHMQNLKKIKELEEAVNGLAARVTFLQKHDHQVSVENDKRFSAIEKRVHHLHDEQQKQHKVIENNKQKGDAELVMIEKTRSQHEKTRTEQHDAVQKTLKMLSDKTDRINAQHDKKGKDHNERMQETTKKLESSLDALQGKFEAIAAEQRAQEARNYSSSDRLRAEIGKGLAEERQKANVLFVQLKDELERLGLEKNQVKDLTTAVQKIRANELDMIKIKDDLQNRERIWLDTLSKTLSEQRTWAESKWGELQEHLDVAIMGVDDRAVNLLNKFEQLCVALVERLQADSEERRKWKEGSLRESLETAMSWAGERRQLLKTPGQSWGFPKQPGYHVSGYPGDDRARSPSAKRVATSMPTMNDPPVHGVHWMGLM